MTEMIILLLVLAAGMVALAYYRGWFSLAGATTNRKSSVTFTVDQSKIKADREKVGEKVEEFGHKIK